MIELRDAVLAVITMYTGTNHEVLDALVDVVAEVIYCNADDKGAKLHALENQWMDRLHAEIAAYDHTEDYHAMEHDS